MFIIDSLARLSRFLADGCHLASTFILINKIYNTRSCSGLSLKTQYIYLIVFLTRYTDLFFTTLNTSLRVYNFFMKILFISSQCLIIFMIRAKYYYTYDKRSDTLPLYAFIVSALVLSFFVKVPTKGLHRYLQEYSWTFSVLIESVAILPQLVLLQETGEAEVLTSRYIFVLGMYRLLYVVSWVCKKMSGIRVDILLIACGIVQTALYADFFVVYYRYVFKQKGKEDKLPM